MEQKVDDDAPGRQAWAENVAGLTKVWHDALSPHGGTKVNAPCLGIVTAVRSTSDSVP
jgi:hypothetical protein